MNEKDLQAFQDHAERVRERRLKEIAHEVIEDDSWRELALDCILAMQSGTGTRRVVSEDRASELETRCQHLKEREHAS